MATDTLHVADQMARAKTVGGLKFGQKLNILQNGDLTSATTAKTNVTNRVELRHVSEQLFSKRINASIDKADTYQPGYTTGGVANAADALEPEGFQGMSLVF